MLGCCGPVSGKPPSLLLFFSCSDSISLPSVLFFSMGIRLEGSRMGLGLDGGFCRGGQWGLGSCGVQLRVKGLGFGDYVDWGFV